MPIGDLKTRNDLPIVLNRLGLVGDGAEIGVFEFEFADHILSHWKGRRLWCVDPWVKQSPKEWRGELSRRDDWPHLWQRALTRAKMSARIALLRCYSHEAAPQIDDASLDFVYLDGNHSLRHVLQDLDLWWPKVKAGGIFGGHDYVNDGGPPHYLEVKPALDDWVLLRGLTFFVTPCTSWWIHKL